MKRKPRERPPDDLVKPPPPPAPVPRSNLHEAHLEAAEQQPMSGSPFPRFYMRCGGHFWTVHDMLERNFAGRGGCAIGQFWHEEDALLFFNLKVEREANARKYDPQNP